MNKVITKVSVADTMKALEVGETVVFDLDRRDVVFNRANFLKKKGMGVFKVYTLARGVRVTRYE